MAVPVETAPDYEEIDVIDVEFGFAFGGRVDYTLFPGDEMTIGPKFIELKFPPRPGVPDVVEIEVQREHVAFRTTRYRTIKKPIKKAAPRVFTSSLPPDNGDA